jgi:hypothetical protein
MAPKFDRKMKAAVPTPKRKPAAQVRLFPKIGILRGLCLELNPGPWEVGLAGCGTLTSF